MSETINARFLKAYRTIWFSLVVFTFLVIPFATLGFIGLIPWLSPAAALMTFLGTFVLHLTVFVAGRPDGLKPKGKHAI